MGLKREKETDVLEMQFKGLGEITFLEIYGYVTTVAFVLGDLSLTLTH